MSKIASWFGAALLALVGLAATLASAFRRGKGAGQEQAAAESAYGQVTHERKVRETVKEVADDIGKMPDAPVQRVDDAGSDTAAGKLRDAGWLRD